MKRKKTGLVFILLLSAAVLTCGQDQRGFTAHTIDDNAGVTASLHSCDLDGDGDTNVLCALLEDSAVVWWRNDGGSPISWKKFLIRAGYDFAHEVYVHDLDRDGDDDVLGASSFLDEITWWRNDGGDPVVWVEQAIGAEFNRAKSVRVADFDKDGDLDVVGAALEGNEVAWWRNEGGDPIRWEKTTISGDFKGAHRVQALDFEGDGNTDILGAAYFGGEIAWWENDGDFAKQTIATGFARACIAAWADMDGDGDLDVVGSSQEGNEVSMWRNDGGSPVSWAKVPVDSLVRVWPLCLSDLDGDGDTDIFAASGFRGVNEVKWWENR